MLASVGIGTEPVWQAIKSGTTGIGPITAFDPTGFNCRIAGEVKGFDPADYVEKKEIKKMGRFIQFAIAAARFALENAQFKVAPEEAEATGVYIGSGIGGFEVIEREHRNLLEKGPKGIWPFLIPATIVNLASGHVSIRSGAKGPNSASHGLHDQRACGGRFVPVGPARGRGCDDLRRNGSGRHTHERGWIRSHAGALTTQRRTGAGFAAMGPRSRRIRDRGRRGDSHS